VTLPALAALVFAGALAAALLGTPLAARLAHATGLLDVPRGRKDHKAPTPLLGGLPIVAVLALAMGGGLALVSLAGEAPPASLVGLLGGDGAGGWWRVERARALERAPVLLGFLGGLLVMFATGLFDDARKETFPSWAKLLGQTIAAAIAVALGARLDILGWAPLNAAASVLWIVAIANAMNFLDHADGLCAGVALAATAVLAATALSQEQYFLLLALAAQGGALLGFLRWNAPPARIFLGDAGALSIGYSLGALTLLESYVTPRSPSLLPAILPPVVLALPLFDMGFVVAARLRAGKPVYVGDRNHLHHRLVRLGMPPRAALATAVLATLALGAGAAALPEVSPAGAAAIVVQVAATMALMALLMVFGGRDVPPEGSDRNPKGPNE